MKFTGFLLKVVQAVSVIGIIAVAGVMCQKPKSAASETPKQAVNDSAMMAGKVIGADTSMKKMDTVAMSKKADTVVAGYYTCPMHPQIHQAKPGTCPICKMDLVFKKGTKTATTLKGMLHSRK